MQHTQAVPSKYNRRMTKKAEKDKRGPKPKPKKHRNWTFFTEEQQKRFEAAQKKKGLDGPPLLSMIFNEWADKEGF